MANLKKALKSWIKGAERIAVLGIGSDLRQDDVAGILVAEAVGKVSGNNGKKGARPYELKIFLGATAPENLTGEIKKFEPTHIIIVDTAEIDQEPGTILVLTPDEVGGGVSFSTHNMPARILVDYFLKSFKCKALIIGIQPKSLEFGKAPSKDIKEAAREVSGAINAVLREIK